MSGVGSFTSHTATKFTLKRNSHLLLNMQAANEGDGLKKAQSPSAQNSEITIREFLDFLKAAYQVHGNIEGVFIAEGMKDTADWIKAKQSALDRAAVFAQGAPDTILNQSEDGRFKDAAVQGTVCANASALQRKLSEMLNEGLLDSVLPYMVPSGTSVPTTAGASSTKVNRVSAAKPHGRCATASSAPSSTAIEGNCDGNNQQVKLTMTSGSVCGEGTSKKSSENSMGGNRSGKSMTSGPSSHASMKKQQQHLDEVEIHVCDEVKNVRKDFRCSASLLLAQMGYFAQVTGTAHQRLDEMEISVHCDVGVFEWLMGWVMRDTSDGDTAATTPVLTATCAVPVLVSAAFLQMESLLQECLLYCHANMNEILRTNASMSCMNDALLGRLAAMYTNAELEAIRDRRDKIHSRLYCKLIGSLCEPEAEAVRGHYCTLAAAYRCRHCHQLIPHPHIAAHIPCVPAHTRLTRDGTVQPRHARDALWSLTEHVATTYRQMQHQWRRTYWRLWAEAHHLYCAVCKRYFPAWQWLWCRYHPDPAQFFTLDNSSATQVVATDSTTIGTTSTVHSLPVGRYPCCGERAYRFQVLDERGGCQFREHIPDTKKIRDAAILTMLQTYKALVTMEPPHLVFPDRLTRLVAKEDNLDQDEVNLNLNKETFWWHGIEILPERDKYGLLGSFLGINSSQESGANSPNKRGRIYGSDLDPTSAFLSTDHDTTDDEYDTNDASNSGSNHSGNAHTSSDEDDSGDADGNTGNNSSDADGHNILQTAADQPITTKRKSNHGRADKKRRARGKKTTKLWQHCSSARSNQDMQRCQEEISFKRINTFLARKTELSADTAVTTNHHRPPLGGGKCTGAGVGGSKLTGGGGCVPVGGLWAKLERDWRDASQGHQMSSQQQHPATLRHHHLGNKTVFLLPTSNTSKIKQLKANK